MHKKYGELASPSRAVTVLRVFHPTSVKIQVVFMRTLCARLGTQFLLEGETSIG